jgi:serine/threonine-protein kinase
MRTVSPPLLARSRAVAGLLVLLGAALLAPRAEARDAADDEKLAQRALAILDRNCARCHGLSSTGEGNMRYILDPRLLVQKKKIVPGDPAKSKLYKRVALEGDMPPEDEKIRPGKEEIAILEQWIKSGAPAPAAGAEIARAFLTDKDTLSAIRDHLRKTPRDSRPFQRYFTLTNLHNNKSVKDAELRQYWAALSKAVNSLSWKPAIVLPEPVDPAQTVLAIDLRRLDWDRHNLWSEILKVYPYGLKNDRYPDDETVNELARDVYDLCGIDLPTLRVDWFIATATRPPLYHTLLRLPKQAGELERSLRVDIPANFLRDQLARAGFATSGVSGQNRLIERHQAAYGAYWKSYDFKSNDNLGNLFRFPLGPQFADNPFPQQAFKHDGGEIIFNLPNGLQGYLLVNGKDERIDEGPIEVVSDGLKTSGTAKIVNGLSCLACHDKGMKSEFKDTVRDGSALGGAARDKVRLLYPRNEEMKKLVQEDEERFLAAVEKATGPYLKVDAGKDREIKDFAEPIGPLARMYLLRELGLEEAAVELGLPDPNVLKGAIQTNQTLRQLGLGPLAIGGTIKREAWESRSRFNSPFQDAANALERGTPKNFQ